VRCTELWSIRHHPYITPTAPWLRHHRASLSLCPRTALPSELCRPPLGLAMRALNKALNAVPVTAVQAPNPVRPLLAPEPCAASIVSPSAIKTHPCAPLPPHTTPFFPQTTHSKRSGAYLAAARRRSTTTVVAEKVAGKVADAPVALVSPSLNHPSRHPILALTHASVAIQDRRKLPSLSPSR
jgi:hypothetical protein